MSRVIGPAVDFAENDWQGRDLRIGSDLVVQVMARTPRCAIPTLEHGDPRSCRLAGTRRAQPGSVHWMTSVPAVRRPMPRFCPGRVGDMVRLITLGGCVTMAAGAAGPCTGGSRQSDSDTSTS